MEPTQITTFKKILDNKSHDTKGSLNNINILKISQWMYDVDFDDLISMFDSEGHKINYRIINELLLLLHSYHTNCIDFIHKNDNLFILNQLLEECSIQEKDCYKGAIINQLINITNLYNNILKVRTFYDIGYNENNYILLYRGFNYTRYKSLINDITKLNIGDDYVTNTFLSTSVLEKVAISFILNDDNIENNVLWSIKINPNYLNKLQYSYLGGDILNIFNLESIIDTGNYESEILLNIGAKLRLIKKYNIHNMTYIYKTININNKNYTVYEFEFMGWDLDKSKMILNKVKELKECLEGTDNRQGTKKRNLLMSPKTPKTTKKIRNTKSIYP